MYISNGQESSKKLHRRDTSKSLAKTNYDRSRISMGYGCSGVSQLSTNYLGSKRHKNKQFAKADAFGLRNIVKRSNLPTNATAGLNKAPS